MQLHYLYSNKKTVANAHITFNGEVQKHCTLVNDEKGFVVRRKFDKAGLICGSETLYGTVVITLPPDVKGGPYKTKAVTTV